MIPDPTVAETTGATTAAEPSAAAGFAERANHVGRFLGLWQ